jgi:hypothetical protein
LISLVLFGALCFQPKKAKFCLLIETLLGWVFKAIHRPVDYSDRGLVLFCRKSTAFPIAQTVEIRQKGQAFPWNQNETEHKVQPQTKQLKPTSTTQMR